MSNVYRFQLFGEPVQHSLSPQIHQAFAQQFNLDVEYTLCSVSAEDFPQAVQAFMAQGGHGANVTLPHKILASDIADEVRPAAKLSGAANTLIFSNDRVIADNTDGLGLLLDLQRWQVDLPQQRVLILGAGGAVNNILPNLLQTQPRICHLANRNIDKAARLVERFQEHGNLSFSSLTEIPLIPYDVIINATSASLVEQVPEIDPQLIHAQAFYYDMVYQHEETSFLHWIREHGGQHGKDGKGMLLEQAALAFKAWTGQQPATSELLTQWF